MMIYLQVYIDDGCDLPASMMSVPDEFINYTDEEIKELYAKSQL